MLGHFVHHGDKFIKSLPPGSSPSTSENGSSSEDKRKQKQKEKQRRISASSFAAVKLQLSGPAPPEFHCHYVGYNTFIKWLYSNSGVMGHLLNHGLRKQYRTIYSYDKNTKYGVIENESSGESSSPCDCLNLPQVEGDSSKPNAALARTFLSLTRFDAGLRLYTYVITLDAEWRFSETGDEFAIDFLSKHMMHADGAPVVMISGEFFVRKIAEFENHSDGGGDEGSKETRENKEGEKAEAHANGDAERPAATTSHTKSTPDQKHEERAPTPEEVDTDPAHYELIIDNNSGTYRPSVDLLPAFQTWLAAPHRLGALGRVTAMDAFDDNLKKMKEERKEEKKRLAGGKLPRKVGVRRGSSMSSVDGEISSMSSSEVEDVLAEAEKKNEKQHAGKEHKEHEGSANDAGKS